MLGLNIFQIFRWNMKYMDGKIIDYLELTQRYLSWFPTHYQWAPLAFMYLSPHHLQTAGVFSCLLLSWIYWIGWPRPISWTPEHLATFPLTTMIGIALMSSSAFDPWVAAESYGWRKIYWSKNHWAYIPVLQMVHNLCHQSDNEERVRSFLPRYTIVGSICSSWLSSKPLLSTSIC